MTLMVVVIVVAGLPAVAINSPSATAAGLTERRCADIDSGDHVRRLSICTRAWIDPVNNQTRGVVEMHTYELNRQRHWVDSRSQSITVNLVQLISNRYYIDTTWGTEAGASTCRIDGPAGRIGCTVPNATRVAFYSPVQRPDGSLIHNVVWEVSWRDDRGVPHYTAGQSTQPDYMPIQWEWWM
jgi:hypothetical protein